MTISVSEEDDVIYLTNRRIALRVDADRLYSTLPPPAIPSHASRLLFVRVGRNWWWCRWIFVAALKKGRKDIPFSVRTRSATVRDDPTPPVVALVRGDLDRAASTMTLAPPSEEDIADFLTMMLGLGCWPEIYTYQEKT